MPTLTGLAHVYGDDIDTDRIIPGKYTKTLELGELARHVLEDLDPGFAARVQPGDLLVAGHNFGCGSSREHAPWALTAYGFRAVISTSFADIFRSNSLKNGLLPIVVDSATHAELFDLAEEAPQAELAVDLESQTVTLPGGRAVSFPIDGFSKACLLQGTDELGYILSFEDKITAYEAAYS